MSVSGHVKPDDKYCLCIITHCFRSPSSLPQLLSQLNMKILKTITWKTNKCLQVVQSPAILRNNWWDGWCGAPVLYSIQFRILYIKILNWTSLTWDPQPTSTVTTRILPMSSSLLILELFRSNDDRSTSVTCSTIYLCYI